MVFSIIFINIAINDIHKLTNNHMPKNISDGNIFIYHRVQGFNLLMQNYETGDAISIRQPFKSRTYDTIWPQGFCKGLLTGMHPFSIARL